MGVAMVGCVCADADRSGAAEIQHAMTTLAQARTYQCTGCLDPINWAQHLAQLDRCDKCARCGICGVSFLRNEIPYQALCGDEQYHQECYREHYAAVEHEPDDCVQSRHRREP